MPICRSLQAACPTPEKDAGRSRPPSTRPCRCRCSPPRSINASARAARRIIRTSCSRRCVSSSADISKNPQHKESIMNDSSSDALVFFGATGDLAYKKIFPALQGMIKHGTLKVPVIGVAKAGWTVEKLRERAYDSLEKHGGV